ncbi:MAG TPA: HD-GYP domain-containing protein [Candidatus Limnocylindria bacterium]
MARFSIALGAVLAATAIVLSAGTAALMSRYVADETTSFTQEAVASHFGTVFSDDVFSRGLSSDELKQLTTFVTFHFSIYNVVATQFYDRDGTLVFSYDASEIGRRIDPATLPPLRDALAGMRSSSRTTIVADARLAVPGQTGRGAPLDMTHQMADGMTAAASLAPGLSRISALESWVPVGQNGQIVGAVVVWRDMDAIDAALQRIQLTIAGIIACAALLLWLVLRGVYVRSSKQIVSQAKALETALAERERTYDTTLQALANALDVRDSETGGHSERVLHYMELITRELGIGGQDAAFLRRGALLHDIGKIGVPDNILRKPAALSESEWATMRKHPEFGARIIADIPFLQDVSKIVRHHHERWDGKGYPDGLAGEEIPVGARIFAVADSFDAMTSDRPYRRGMSVAAACAEIARCRGTQFDPTVADAFLRIQQDRLADVADDAPHAHPVAIAG